MVPRLRGEDETPPFSEASLDWRLRDFLRALLGGLGGGAQVQGSIDQRDVGESLGKVAEKALLERIVFLGEQPDIVGEAGQTVEQRARLVQAALQAQVVGQPEAAGKEHPLARRQPVDGLVRAVALHQSAYGQ